MRDAERSGPEQWPIISLFLTWIGGMVLLAMIGSGLGLMREGSATLEVSAPVVMLLPPFVWIAGQLRRRQLAWSELLGPVPAERPWGRWLGLVAGLIAVSVGAVWALWTPLSYLWPDFVESWVLDDSPLLVGSSPLDRAVHALIMFVLIVGLAPIIEELLFRGVLLRRWARLWGPVAAVVASSLLFGALHADMLGGAFFGFAMCVLALRGGGVRVPILIHALNNASGYAFALIDELFRISGPAWTIEDFRSHAVWALPLFAVSAIWAVWWGRRAVRGIEWTCR